MPNKDKIDSDVNEKAKLFFKDNEDKEKTINFLIDYKEKSYLFSNHLIRILTLLTLCLLFTSIVKKAYELNHNNIDIYLVIYSTITFILILTMTNDIWVTILSYLFSNKKIKKSLVAIMNKSFDSIIILFLLFTGAVIFLCLSILLNLSRFETVSSIHYIITYGLIFIFIVVIALRIYHFYKQNNIFQCVNTICIIYFLSFLLPVGNYLIPKTIDVIVAIIKLMSTQC